jgi:hypothetical protein
MNHPVQGAFTSLVPSHGRSICLSSPVRRCAKLLRTRRTLKKPVGRLAQLKTANLTPSTQGSVVAGRVLNIPIEDEDVVDEDVESCENR